MMISKGVVLIVGAGGLVGRAAIEQYLAQGGCEVIAQSRRAPEPATGAAHVAVELTDVQSCRMARHSDAHYQAGRGSCRRRYDSSPDSPGRRSGSPESKPDWTKRGQRRRRLAAMKSSLAYLYFTV
jgi:NAD(P)-dependent dehydrogenase (short-subunit alcohol dehydrogenase family)